MDNPLSNTPSSQKTVGNLDWYKIACKIRDQNRELKAKISELSEQLSTHQEGLNQQAIELERKETLIKQQAQRIDDLDREFQQQKLDEEKNQESELIIQTLNQELEKVQQQAANLERECSFLQDKYNQQEHLLKEKEKENQELQTRLQRQQRYNLQYKSALDQYLQSSPETKQNENTNVTNLPEHHTIEPWDQSDNNLNNQQNLDKISSKILNNLTEIVFDEQRENKEKEEILNLINDAMADSTEAKIDSLISEIEKEIETIGENKEDKEDKEEENNNKHEETTENSPLEVDEKEIALPQIDENTQTSSQQNQVENNHSKPRQFFLKLPNFRGGDK